LEKAMKLKSTEVVYFGHQKNGKIYIEQHSNDWGDMVHIYLSPEQFRAIKNWFYDFEDAIDDAWNMGVDDDPQT
jgi:hypothetical protein